MKTVNALVAFSDLANYIKLANTKSPEELFALLSGYYEYVGDLAARSGGEIIKFMGDAVLMLFPENEIDPGIQTLFALQEHGDHYFASRGLPCRHRIRAHYGPVLIGKLGTRNEKHTDILGETVNTLFLFKSASELAITPNLFRKLSKESRKRFKKHTPPITYIPATQRHRD